MTGETMIRFDHVTKRYPGSSSPAVTDLSLEIDKGQFVTLVGPSGCGKTTSLKMINRIIEPTSGRIEVNGVDALSVPPSQLRRSIGYVIQQIGLFPHRTISQNIATVPSLLGWEPKRITERVDELIALVGMDAELLGRYPSELSGGQHQRVGVARALAADPPVLLMDEPFGAVDPIVRGRLQEEFLELQRTLGKTVVFVTHDVDEAIYLGTRTAILNVGGVLEQFDTPEAILSSPASPFVEDFLGGERGLKRLALTKVGDGPLAWGPVVAAGGTIQEALEVMKAHDVKWVTVLDGERLRGWISQQDVMDHGIDPDRTQPFLVTLSNDDSMREALDAVVTSKARVAVVVDGERYLGMLDLDAIAEGVTE